MQHTDTPHCTDLLSRGGAFLSMSLVLPVNNHSRHGAEQTCGRAGAGPILALATERPPAPQARLRARAGLAGQHALLLAHLKVLLVLHQACLRLTLP